MLPTHGRSGKARRQPRSKDAGRRCRGPTLSGACRACHWQQADHSDPERSPLAKGVGSSARRRSRRRRPRPRKRRYSPRSMKNQRRSKKNLSKHLRLPQRCMRLAPTRQGRTIQGIFSCIIYNTYLYLLLVLCICITEEFDFDRRQSRFHRVLLSRTIYLRWHVTAFTSVVPNQMLRHAPTQKPGRAARAERCRASSVSFR